MEGLVNRVAVTLHGCTKRRISINCLLDTGSQWSYFSKELKYDKNSNLVNFQVKTYLGVSTKRLEQVVLKINVGNEDYFIYLFCLMKILHLITSVK